MNARRLISGLSAAALGCLLILSTSASAKGPSGCGYRDCGQPRSCESNRWHKPSHRGLIIYVPVYGKHAVRGWDAPYRIVESRRGPGFSDRSGFGWGSFR
jgi:hypothetical protein